MIQGLTEREVEQRRQAGQGNTTAGVTSRSYVHIIRKNVFTFVNMVLFTIGVLLVLLGSPSDAITTAGLVLMNVLVGVVQEIRAKRKLDQITLLTRPRVTVIRDGQEHAVDSSDLVLGDVIRVEPGDQIVCDGCVVGEGRMEVDESLLTGESDYIPKHAGDPVYSGSFCVSGGAFYEATQVGRDSLANAITAKARRFEASVTPLQQQVNTVVRWVGVVCVVLGVGLLARAVAIEMTVTERVQMAAVIMGSIPQGLIFLVTLAYALGATRLIGRGVLVQQINAVESLSHISVLCMDKTGTLTTNRITFDALVSNGLSEQRVKSLLGDFVASVTNPNRTSEAVAAALPGQSHPLAEELPFGSAHKWSGLIFDDGVLPGALVLGAPEVIMPDLETAAADLNGQLHRWSDGGLRVILLAHAPEANTLHAGDGNPQLPRDLEPLGLVALRDELRPDAAQTLDEFTQAGIRLKIISGDSPRTVAALAAQVGFHAEGGLITGDELDRLDDTALAQAVHERSIFGRIKPDQKERLVEALRAGGDYVAMIGDGVNDVLALKRAHVGIAMHSGSAAARNVSDIVLLNDSFTALPAVFQEGQRIVNGILDTMRLLLSRTVYVLLVIALTALAGAAFPFLPTQDALNSFLTAGLPPVLLALWAVAGQPPSDVLGAVRRFVFPAAISIAVMGTAVYLYALYGADSSVETARTALVTTVIGCGTLLILFVKPPLEFWAGAVTRATDWRPAGLAVGVMLLFGLIVTLEPLRAFFDLERLNAAVYGLIALVVVFWMLALRVFFGRAVSDA